MKVNTLKTKIEVLFIYEFIREVDFTPSCIIFYLKNDVLFRIDFRASATILKDTGHYSVSSFLDVESTFLEDSLEDAGEPADDLDIASINDTTDEIKDEKAKLKGIRR